MAVKPARAGEYVTIIARGEKLDAAKKNGIKPMTQDGDELFSGNLVATDNMSDVCVQDMVILAVKTHQIAAIAKEVDMLFGPDTTVLTIQSSNKSIDFT